MPLDDLRKKINSIDDEILRLLETRASFMDSVAQEKRAANMPTYDPERERAVLERLADRAGRFPRETIIAVYREVMSACLAMQERVRVAFLGPTGTFTHQAARELFGLAAEYTEAATIDGVFDAVHRESVSFGVVPIENSSEGSVTRTVDALIEGNVFIRREQILEVEHCLITRAAGLASIERVYSHPQALGQCRGWLAKNLGGAQLVQAPSTAAAARECAADHSGAAIGSRLAAELLGIPILQHRIQDHSQNATRFVLLASSDAPPSGNDKTTLAFSIKEGKGALRRALEVFDEAGINLTRIESRPSQRKAWDYVFLVDLEGHRLDVDVSAAVDALTLRCPMVKQLGSYPKAPKP